jgi:hypothetical protein
METYTAYVLVNGEIIGRNTKATLREVTDLVSDDDDPFDEKQNNFLLSLRLVGSAVTADRYKVYEGDAEETLSVFVAVKNP